jgi:phosphoserine phosphatase
MRIEHRPSYAPPGLRVNSSLGTTAPSAPAFRTVVIDLEAAAPHMECFDWLARRRGDIVRRRVAELIGERQDGTLDPGTVCRECLALIRPRRSDLDALAGAYVAEVPGEATSAVRRLKREGVRVVLVSAGLRYALLRLGARLELDLSDIHGVDIRFDALGAYVGFDAGSALAGLDVELPTLVPQSFAQLASLALI